MSNVFYGWFDDASQPIDKPTYDPPHDTPCLYCGKAITPDDVRTHSVMQTEGYGTRSYFYRTHRTCDEKNDVTDLDSFIFEMVAHNGD